MGSVPKAFKRLPMFLAALLNPFLQLIVGTPFFKETHSQTTSGFRGSGPTEISSSRLLHLLTPSFSPPWSRYPTEKFVSVFSFACIFAFIIESRIESRRSVALFPDLKPAFQ